MRGVDFVLCINTLIAKQRRGAPRRVIYKYTDRRDSPSSQSCDLLMLSFDDIGPITL